MRQPPHVVEGEVVRPSRRDCQEGYRLIGGQVLALSVDTCHTSENELRGDVEALHPHCFNRVRARHRLETRASLMVFSRPSGGGAESVRISLPETDQFARTTRSERSKSSGDADKSALSALMIMAGAVRSSAGMGVLKDAVRVRFAPGGPRRRGRFAGEPLVDIRDGGRELVGVDLALAPGPLTVAVSGADEATSG